MSAAVSANTWDEVWAEFDSRQAARAQSAMARPADPPRTETPQDRRPLPNALLERVGSQAEHAQAAPAAKPQRPRSLLRSKRLLALLACTAIAVYAGSPVASAVQVAAAIQRGDADALAQYIDWSTLRPALNAALEAETRRPESQPMPSFITAMTTDMAERLSSPAGLASLLNQRLAPGGSQPARDMLSGVRMREAGLWDVTLTSTQAPERSAKLTLALTDVTRLRWEVQAIQLPQPGTARPR